MSDALSFNMADANVGGMVIQADHRRVEFRTGQRLLTRQSQEAGRPIYAPVDLFCVRHPGERDEQVVEATEFHKITHPRHWQAYVEGRKADQEGTPLAVLFPAEPFIVTHLRSIGIFTVEMLASASEEGLRRVGMGAREYQARAQKLMDAAERSAPTRELEAKLQSQADEIQALRDQLNLVLAAPRRGRPPKETEE